MKIKWKGTGIKSRAYDDKGNCIITCDKRYFRLAEVDKLLGNPSKAKRKLKWKPKIDIKQLVKEMIEEDLKLAKKTGE